MRSLNFGADPGPSRDRGRIGRGPPLSPPGGGRRGDASPRRGRFPWFLGAGVVAEIAYFVLALWPGPARPTTLLLCLPAFAAYGVAIRVAGKSSGAPWLSVRAVLVFAALFRITLLFTPPMLSDDLYRYLWDGRVQLQGINPYRFPPSAPELAGLRDPLSGRINHPEVPTIYPPLSQILFLVTAWTLPGVTGIKLAFTLCEYGGILILWQLLKRLGGSPLSLLLYAWNPLAVVEVAGNGHNDPLGVTCLLLAVLLILQKRPRLSIVALAGSILSKWVSAAFLPFFLLSGNRRPAGMWIPARLGALLGTAGLLWLPYASAGWGLFLGFREYAHRWRHNDFAFSLVVGFFERLDPTDLLKAGIRGLPSRPEFSAATEFLYRHVYPPDLAKLVVLGILLAVAVVLTVRQLEIHRRVFWMMGGILLLTPTLHPWYLLWILPLAALEGSSAWFLFSGLVMLSYLPAASGEGITLWRMLEYVPFFALLSAEYLKGRRGPERGRSGIPPAP